MTLANVFSYFSTVYELMKYDVFDEVFRRFHWKIPSEYVES